MTVQDGRTALDLSTQAALRDPREGHVLETDDVAWDAFVAASPGGSYLQTSAWAEVKRANGWSPRRVALTVDGRPLGSQMLIRRAGRLPWSVAYIGRGPVGAELTRDSLAPLTEALARAARAAGVAYLVFEPEAETAHGMESELLSLGWRRTTHIQPEATRIIDLRRSPDELWADLRPKWRQYVNKARRAGLQVVEAGEDRLSDFYAIYADAYRRAGVSSRSAESFLVLWRALAPRGMARLLIAQSSDGQPAAVLMLLSCGSRLAEVYGGSTPAGNAARANYLLKWESIRIARERGFAEYDMFGIPHAGIAHFKAGFGGREVHYVGAWQRLVDPFGGRILALANALRAAYIRTTLRSSARGAQLVSE